MDKVKSVLRMASGLGETSYAANSKLQEEAIIANKRTLEDAVDDVFRTLEPIQKMVAADLGCSSGPNTLAFALSLLCRLGSLCQESRRSPLEVQIFLNDLPMNDFNTIFRSIDNDFERRIKKEMVDVVDEYIPAHYLAAVSGSFYKRLFPQNSVNLFHSSSALHYISQIPEGVENKNNIFIASNSPPTLKMLYQEQHRKDLSLFLRLRSEEMAPGGQMVLAFPGTVRSSINPGGELGFVYEAISEAFRTLVQQGRVEQQSLDKFNIPNYGATQEEVRKVVEEEGSFQIISIQMTERNWDPFDDDDDLVDMDIMKLSRSGVNIANMLRAIFKPIIVSHFGSEIVDDLFTITAQNLVSRMILTKQKVKCAFVATALKVKK